MRAFHSLTASDTLSALQSSPVGLSEEEAQSRLQRLGENALPSRKKGGPFRLFLAQFKDFMTILLLCAAALSAVVAFWAEDAGGLTDTGILLLIVLLNAVVGFIQQYRADTAVEKLDRLSVCRVKAVRGGRDLLLDSRALVPGDLIVLEEGDMIPADCRILRAEELRCDESALTGESSGVSKSEAPVPESAPLAERRCMLYSSSFVVRGRAAAVVVGTGKDTEIGQIAGILAQTDAAKTPLEKALSVLGRIITAFVAAVAALLFLVGIFCKGEPLLHGFLSAVAVAVAAIPEGMPAVVTVIMAMGVQKMSRERAIVRRLHAVETLGGCSHICSDKTGTLTQNRMTVETVVTNFAPFRPPAGAQTPAAGQVLPEAGGSERAAGEHSAGERHLLACMLLCNSVRTRGGKPTGDPTEVALAAYARGRGARAHGRVLGGIPFSSESKRMTVSAETDEGRFDYVKGGADVLSDEYRKPAAGASADMYAFGRRLEAKMYAVCGENTFHVALAEHRGISVIGLPRFADLAAARAGEESEREDEKKNAVLEVALLKEYAARERAQAGREALSWSEDGLIGGFVYLQDGLYCAKCSAPFFRAPYDPEQPEGAGDVFAFSPAPDGPSEEEVSWEPVIEESFRTREHAEAFLRLVLAEADAEELYATLAE